MHWLYYIIIVYYILGIFKYVYIRYNSNEIEFSIFEENDEIPTD
jgi:hypothetical protein